MEYFKKFFGHLKTVLVHKYWVYWYMARLGYPLRGFFHDSSKFSPVEFFESVRYWSGKRSPILGAKEEQKISYAWQHHKGRNKHHYEYWIDNLDNGGEAKKIPFKYVIEMVCDWLAAGKTYEAYDGGNIFIQEELWWSKKKETAKINEQTSELITKILWNMSQTAHYQEFDGVHLKAVPVRKTERTALRIIRKFLKNWKYEYENSETK